MKRDVFATISLGSLVGMLAGLSTSPVVGALVGSLAAFAVAWVSVRGMTDGREGALGKAAAIRVASFSLSCLIFALIGIYVRTHSMLSPSLDDQIRDWTRMREAGVPAEIAATRVFERDDLFSTLISESNTELGASRGVAKPSTLHLHPRHQTVGEVFDAENWISELKRAGGPWSNLADRLEGMNSDEVRQVALSLAALFGDD